MYLPAPINTKNNVQLAVTRLLVLNGKRRVADGQKARRASVVADRQTMDQVVLLCRGTLCTLWRWHQCYGAGRGAQKPKPSPGGRGVQCKGEASCAVKHAEGPFQPAFPTRPLADAPPKHIRGSGTGTQVTPQAQRCTLHAHCRVRSEEGGSQGNWSDGDLILRQGLWHNPRAKRFMGGMLAHCSDIRRGSHPNRQKGVEVSSTALF